VSAFSNSLLWGVSGLATSLLTNDILIGVSTGSEDFLGERTRDVLQGGRFNSSSVMFASVLDSNVSTFFDVLPDVEVPLVID
jgi:hypothetical protein